MNYYQCRHCGNKPVKASSIPNASGCTVKNVHQWVNLGKEGFIVYSCRHCGTQVETKQHPNSSGCTVKNVHQWVKLADNTPKPQNHKKVRPLHLL